MDIVPVVAVAVINSAPTEDRQEEREKPSPPDHNNNPLPHICTFKLQLVPQIGAGSVTVYKCLPKKEF
jgi:hypothetical protein